MKNLTQMILTTFALFMLTSSFAQTKEIMTGKWKVTSETEGIIRLERVKTDSTTFHDWGNFFEFHSDGTYTESASAPCGLDDNRYTYSGKWNIPSGTKWIELTDIKVINDRPNIYSTYKVLKTGKLEIISYEQDHIQLKVVRAWETSTPK